MKSNSGARKVAPYQGRIACLTASMTLILGTCPTASFAGGVASAAAEAAIKRMLGREAARDAASPALILRSGATLSRYATAEEAQIESRLGLRAGQHLTGPVESSRKLSSADAVARYGLQHKTPAVLERWALPAGMPIKVNPVWGGARGAKETVIDRPLGPKSLIKVEPLQPR